MSRPARIWRERISKNQAAVLVFAYSEGVRPQHGGVKCNTKSSIFISIFISRAGKRGQENLPPMCMKKYAVRACAAGARRSSFCRAAHINLFLLTKRSPWRCIIFRRGSMRSCWIMTFCRTPIRTHWNRRRWR